MTTDNKAVAWYVPTSSHGGMVKCLGWGEGTYVSDADHERVGGQLRAEIEGLKKDAERYRWLRDHAGKDDDQVEIFIEQESYAPGHLDAQVDAAMEKGNV